MALVTNPYATSSSHSSYSDDCYTDDEETTEVRKSRLNECRKEPTTLMLGSNKRLRASCEEQHPGGQGVSNASSSFSSGGDTGSSAVPVAQRKLPERCSGTGTGDNNGDRDACDSLENVESEGSDTGQGSIATMGGGVGGGSGVVSGGGGSSSSENHTRADGPPTSRPASSCSSGSCSSSSEIQLHLQSMFYLLRPEETLKMAVKLESLRPGRTRYLVVVSRSVSSKRLGTYAAGSNGNLHSSATASATGSLQSSRPGSVLSGAGASRQGFAAAAAVADAVVAADQDSDTYVSSLQTCLLSVPPPHGARLPATTAAACRNDQCDSKTNTRVSSSDLGQAVPEATSAGRYGDDETPQGTFPDGIGTSGFGTSSSLDQQQQQFPQPPASGDGSISGGASAGAALGESGKDIEESCLLGIDCNERTTVGLVLKVLADTSIRLDGDGGFSVSSCGKQHIFKPVSVQTMWSALQTLHKVSSKAREHNFFAGGPSHDWVAYYETHIDSDRSCLNEWNAMDSLESRRPPSPGSIRSKPTKREETESVIRSKLKEVMMSVDLDDVTSKFIRGRLEELLDMDLGEYKPFIDGEMLVILGQMDAPTEIFDHVYLGSEWNASNLEELQRNGVRHILNVTREIDNFFPGLFNYCNVRVYDDEKTDLLRHWDNTFKFISRAKMEGSKVLVHCKMGISRSASVVIAYAMKANNWDFDRAIRHVKEKRNCIKPNKNFLMQLETYQGMLDAMKNKEKLQRSKSETNLKLAGAKEGRSLPGSEPTPLIQALSVRPVSGVGIGWRKYVADVLPSATATLPVAALRLSKRLTDDNGHTLADSAPAGPVFAANDRAAEKQDEIGAEARTNVAADVLVHEQDGALPRPGRSRIRHQKEHEQNEQQQEQAELQLEHQHEQTPSNLIHQGSASTAMATAARPSLCNTSSRESGDGGFAGRGNRQPQPFSTVPCRAGGVGAVRRHKSLSPDKVHARWFRTCEPAALAASVTPRKAIEPATHVRGASVPPANHRKHQSYSLEHLHGLLEMRSPCAETKTIRMPCGNGQNYSVSPNQIVHLQDKLPKGGGREATTRTSPIASPLAAPSPRKTSILRKLFSTVPHDTTTPTTSSAEAFVIDSSFAVGCCAASQHPATTTPLTVPSSSLSSEPSVASASTGTMPPATVALSNASSSSSVKTIVCELELGGANRASYIPVAPPLSSDCPVVTGPAFAAGAAIPIASIAAEAAAVAAASAASLSRKEQGEQQPICWTSSAQIIQQTDTMTAVAYAYGRPEQDEGRCDRSAMRAKEEEPRHVESGEIGEPGAASDLANQPDDVVLTHAQQCPISTGLLESSSSLDEPLVNEGSKSVTMKKGSDGAGSRRQHGVVEPTAMFPADREDIPWHPGTVRRTKEKIEERSSSRMVGTVTITASSTGGGSSNLKRTASSCSTDHHHQQQHVPVAFTLTSLASSSTASPPAEEPREAGGQQQASSQFHRARHGMVSTSYARLSASAPDSYNMYARTPGGTTASAVAAPPAASSTGIEPATPTPKTGDAAGRFRATTRASFSGASEPTQRPKPAPEEAEEEPAADAFNHAGKVRNLKMSFEAKSNDRRREQKKVRSLPSSPVAVHALMTGQPRPKPPGSPSSSSPSPSLQQDHEPPAGSGLRSPQTSRASPSEDVTVRDLVDRYEVHGPRARTSSNGGSGSSGITNVAPVPAVASAAAAATAQRPRPRSVFEGTLKAASAQNTPTMVNVATPPQTLPKPTPHLLSHATAPFRLEEYSRPPVPPAAPHVRGLLLPAADPPAATHPLSTNINNNNHHHHHSASMASFCTLPGRRGSSHSSSGNVRNNNGGTEGGDGTLQQADGPNRKRAQQHGRTHPLAKINPTGGRHHQHQQQQHQQFNPLQQHRLAGSAQAATVSGAAPAGPPSTTNMYNTIWDELDPEANNRTKVKLLNFLYSDLAD